MAQEKKMSKDSNKSSTIEPDETIRPPWSNKKRIAVSALMTMFIMSVAIIIGSFVYEGGIRLGIFSSQSIHKIISEQLFADTQFLHEIEQAATAISCTNGIYGIHLQYPSTLQPHALSSDEFGPCLTYELVANPSTKQPVIVLTQFAGKRSETINSIVHGLTQVQTDSVQHPRYQVTRISGIEGLVEAIYFVIGAETMETTWVLKVAPVTNVSLSATQFILQELEIDDLNIN